MEGGCGDTHLEEVVAFDSDSQHVDMVPNGKTGSTVQTSQVLQTKREIELCPQNEEDQRALIFLMVHALQQTPFQHLGQQLADEAKRYGMLPYRVDYAGQRHECGYDELQGQVYSHLAPSALLTALQRLRDRQQEDMDNVKTLSEGREGLRHVDVQAQHDEGQKPEEVECIVIDGDDEMAVAKNTEITRKNWHLSLLDGLVLGSWEGKPVPRSWVHPLPSMHHGMRGENMVAYLGIRETGWLASGKMGLGLPVEVRHPWQHQFTVRGHSMATYCVTFDRTGDLIITASDDRLVKIWSSRTALLQCCCQGHIQEVSDLAVSSDNKVLASASVDGHIRLWRLQSDSTSEPMGMSLGLLRGHQSLVSSINFSPQTSYELLSSSFDGTCRVWDIRTGESVSLKWNWSGGRRRQVAPVNMNLRSMQSAGGIDSGSEDENRRSLRPRRHHEQREYPAPQSEEPGAEEHEEHEEDSLQVSVAMFSQSGKHIIAGIANGSTCLWRWYSLEEAGDSNPREAAEVKPVELLHSEHNSDVYLLEQSHGGNMFASASRDGIVCLWKPGKGGHHRRIVPLDTWKCFGSFGAPPEEEEIIRSRKRRGPPPRVDQIAWNADDTYVLASVQNFKILVFSVRENRVVRELSGVHTEPVHVVLCSPTDPAIAVTASYSGDIAIWDIMKGEPLKTISSVDSRPDGRKWPDSIAYVDGYMSPDGQYAALTDAGGQLHVIGIGPADDWISRAPYDQFFSTDYDDLIEDEQGNIMRVVGENQEPANERNGQETLCDATATPYPQGFQIAFRNRTLLSSPWKDVAWIQPGQQPAYVMMAPTIAAAQWRVLASGGSQNAAQQAVNRAQLRLQEYENRIDMGEVENDTRNRLRANAHIVAQGQQWDTISVSDGDLDDGIEESQGRRNTAIRHSQRLAQAAQQEDEAMDGLDARERQRLERQRRRERRQMRDEDTRLRRSIRRRVPTHEEEFVMEPDDDTDVSLEDEDSDVEEDEAGPSQPSRGATRKRDRSGRRGGSETVATAPRDMHHYQWLISHKKMGGLYVPQLGDEVVYIRKGHQAALEESSSTLIPPWRSLSRGSLIRAAEPCLVKNMEYFIDRDQTSGTCVMLDLEFSDTRSELCGQSFQVELFSPLSGYPDFIVLKSVYENLASHSWSAGDQCMTMFWEDSGETWWTGTIQEDKMGSFQVPICVYTESNLWERFTVVWQDGETSSHSPWELRTPDNLSNSSDTLAIPQQLGDRVKQAIATASQQECWELFQIAPLSTDIFTTYRGVNEYYNQVVALPIGLADIQERIDNNYYRQQSALANDISTLARNAGQFNGNGSDVHKDAKTLQAYLLAVMEGTSEVVDAGVYAAQSAAASEVEEEENTRTQRSRRNGRQSNGQAQPTRRSNRRAQRRLINEMMEDELTEEEEQFFPTSAEEDSLDSSSSESSSSDDEDTPHETAGPPAASTRFRLRRA